MALINKRAIARLLINLRGLYPGRSRVAGASRRWSGTTPALAGPKPEPLALFPYMVYNTPRKFPSVNFGSRNEKQVVLQQNPNEKQFLRDSSIQQKK